jgi:hypothetical protein
MEYDQLLSSYSPPIDMEADPSSGSGICVFESILLYCCEHVAAPHHIMFQRNNPYFQSIWMMNDHFE